MSLLLPDHIYSWLCVFLYRCVTVMGTATVTAAGHHPFVTSQDWVAVWTVDLSSTTVSRHIQPRSSTVCFWIVSDQVLFLFCFISNSYHNFTGLFLSNATSKASKSKSLAMITNNRQGSTWQLRYISKRFLNFHITNLSQCLALLPI